MNARCFSVLCLAAIASGSLSPNGWSGTAGSVAIAHAEPGPPTGGAPPVARLLATGLQGGAGSAIGPGGALYVTETAAGRISRVDPKTGVLTTFATGLPPAILGIGGAMDVAFIGGTAYALVTLVGEDVLGDDPVGIYRMTGPNEFELFADIGTFSIEHPPDMMIDVPSGLQYAIERFHGGFFVTDGHHNRVLRVTEGGEVSELIAFDNVVPTGLAVRGNTILVAEAGPVPHLPQDGKIVAFGPKSLNETEIASGARLLVDVEYGRGRTLYALSQGEFPPLGNPAEPALPNTGALVRVNADGTFTTIVDRLNQPTSLEFIGDTACIVTLGGEVWVVENVSGPPYGSRRPSE
jgi:sugar lactone lactonase YvrE